MKKSIILSFIFTLCIISLFAQGYKPWNVSLNITPYARLAIIAPAVNRSMGKRFEVGAMPIFQFQKRKPSNSYNYQQTSIGLNITGRYFLGRGQVMDPYIASIVGFGTSLEESSFTSRNGTTNENSSQTNFFDITLMLGNEINIGQKGWILDFNVGLLGTKFYDDRRNFEVLPIYSFGIKKKFRSK